MLFQSVLSGPFEDSTLLSGPSARAFSGVYPRVYGPYPGANPRDTVHLLYASVFMSCVYPESSPESSSGGRLAQFVLQILPCACVLVVM